MVTFLASTPTRARTSHQSPEFSAMILPKYSIALAALAPFITSARAEKPCRISRTQGSFTNGHAAWATASATNATFLGHNETFDGLVGKYLTNDETSLPNGASWVKNDTYLSCNCTVLNSNGTLAAGKATFEFNNGSMILNNGTIAVENDTAPTGSGSNMQNGTTIANTTLPHPYATVPVTINATAPERRNNTPWTIQADYSGTTFFDG